MVDTPTTAAPGGASHHRPIGVGIVGLSASGGWASGAHLPALRAVEGLELRGLTASSPESGRTAARAYGVPAHASVGELARDGAIDLVVVAVKVPHHRELILPALEAGTAVLSEWPLAVDLREAELLAAAAGDIRTFVGLQGRSSPVARWVTDLVADGYVGDVLSVSVVAASSEWGAPVSERGRYTLDRALGATMLAIAVGHEIDLVSMIVGELQDVVATTTIRRPAVPLGHTGTLVPVTGEDQVAVSGMLPSGAILSLHHRSGTAAGAGFSLRVDGSHGTLELTAPSYPQIAPPTVRGARGRAPLEELALPSTYDRFPHLAGTPVHALAHAYAALRDDLVHGARLVPDFSHAVRRHRLLDAIQRSAATGERVDLAKTEASRL